MLFFAAQAELNAARRDALSNDQRRRADAEARVEAARRRRDVAEAGDDEEEKTAARADLAAAEEEAVPHSTRSCRKSRDAANARLAAAKARHAAAEANGYDAELAAASAELAAAEEAALSYEQRRRRDATARLDAAAARVTELQREDRDADDEELVAALKARDDAEAAVVPTTRDRRQKAAAAVAAEARVDALREEGYDSGDDVLVEALEALAAAADATAAARQRKRFTKHFEDALRAENAYSRLVADGADATRCEAARAEMNALFQKSPQGRRYLARSLDCAEHGVSERVLDDEFWEAWKVVQPFLRSRLDRSDALPIYTGATAAHLCKNEIRLVSQRESMRGRVWLAGEDELELDERSPVPLRGELLWSTRYPSVAERLERAIHLWLARNYPGLALHAAIATGASSADVLVHGVYYAEPDVSRRDSIEWWPRTTAEVPTEVDRDEDPALRPATPLSDAVPAPLRLMKSADDVEKFLLRGAGADARPYIVQQLGCAVRWRWAASVDAFKFGITASRLKWYATRELARAAALAKVLTKTRGPYRDTGAPVPEQRGASPADAADATAGARWPFPRAPPLADLPAPAPLFALTPSPAPAPSPLPAPAPRRKRGRKSGSSKPAAKRRRSTPKDRKRRRSPAPAPPRRSSRPRK